jgi:hypothetical protein
MKEIELHNAGEIAEYVELLQHSADEAKLKIMDFSNNASGIMLLQKMKFDEFGFDPLDSARPLNIIEQVNQTFTYLASFKSAEMLFLWHQDLSCLKLNLGTSGGTDIEAAECGGIAAETFAATRLSSNNKLNKDIEKVSKVKAKHKYVMFLCPAVPPGEYQIKKQSKIKLWSLEH